jgi:hypothetical protein
MNPQAFTQEGYRLLHDGAIELARIEATGIRIDVARLKRTKLELERKLRELKDDIQKDDLWAKWRRRFAGKTNMSSRDQLAWIIYKELGLEVKKTTQGGAASVDDSVLQDVDHPFARNISAFYRYDKTLNTFLRGIEREICGDRLHPFFHLHTARTIRSSSSDPNFQNFPVRNKEISQMIRSLFIASKYSVLPENDFKGIEVAISAAYHKDENFISYITTPGKDMHGDMAMQIYGFTEKEWKELDPKVAKDARYGAKNKFVFPQFYGDWYLTCAKNLWEWIDKGELKTKDGKSFKDHLRKKGVKKLGACEPEQQPEDGTFEKHLQTIEKDFWGRRFRQYGEWRRRFYNEYLDKGYFDILSGFRIRGAYSRNQVTNAPVQGAAFHCLLWSLIQINRELRKYKFKSAGLVGQIHDSLLGDIRVDELKDYLEIVDDVTTKRLPKHFDWMEVSPEIEYEISPVLEPWSEKMEFKFKLGKFKHPDKDIWTADADVFLKAMAGKKKEKEDLEPRNGHRSNHQVKVEKTIS